MIYGRDQTFREYAWNWPRKVRLTPLLLVDFGPLTVCSKMGSKLVQKQGFTLLKGLAFTFKWFLAVIRPSEDVPKIDQER